MYCKENEIISQKGTGHDENLALRAWQAGTSDTGVLKLRYILLLPLNIELMSKMLRFPVADIYLERIQIMMVKVWSYAYLFDDQVYRPYWSLRDPASNSDLPLIL